MTEYATPTEMQSRLEAVGKELQQAVLDEACAGAIVGIIKPGELPEFISRGTHSYTDQRPLTPTDQFDIASITKLLTALTIFRMHQESPESNILRLPINDAAPALFDSHDRWPVTVGDLLRMGVRWNTGESLSAIAREIQSSTANPTEARARLLQRIAQSDIEILPEGQEQYQDATYIVLAYIIEQLNAHRSVRHGESSSHYEAIVRHHVLAPLGMHDTTLSPDIDRCVPGGTRDGKLILGTPHDPKATFAVGHAGFFSTCADLCKLAAMLHGEGVVGSNQFLIKNTMEMLTQPHGHEPDKGAWCMGIRKKGDAGNTPTGHFGPAVHPDALFITGFTGGSILVDPRLSVVMLTNYHVVPDPTPATRDKTFEQLISLRRKLYTTLLGS